jgi:hypothetical protein
MTTKRHILHRSFWTPETRGHILRARQLRDEVLCCGLLLLEALPTTIGLMPNKPPLRLIQVELDRLRAQQNKEIEALEELKLAKRFYWYQAITPPSPPFPVGGVSDEGKGVLAPQG